MKLRQRWITIGLLILLIWLCSILVAIRYGNSTHKPDDRVPVHWGINYMQPPLNLSLLRDRDISAKSKPGLKGLPKESTIYIVPRKHPNYTYVEVKNRSKFEALFRDFQSLNKVPKTLLENDRLHLFENPSEHNEIFERFFKGINRYELYPYNDSDVIEPLMKYLGQAPIVSAKEKGGGTQVKLFFTFEDQSTAIMKPWRVPREYETLPDHYYFADIERHTAEIAAFHLDRILDFRRAPPVTGRILNMTSDIRRVSSRALNKTFFISPANNLCFMTDCSQYCGISRTPVCGNPDLIESSIGAYLPLMNGAKRKSFDHPFKRSYSKRSKAAWEDNPMYCKEVVMKQTVYSTGRRMLDIIDLAIFDFLMGNMDRHSYYVFKYFGNYSTIFNFDHGRGFGRYQTDELSCLVPLTQCCIIRKSTYQRLLILQKDEYKLGDVMRESLSTDIIAPVLYEAHYAALDRRLGIIINAVRKCTSDAKNEDEVLKPSH
ncbi:putative extracellular serine/threonine protein kinase FAM20C [Apostichopus japonicus]|uniref:Putative extracellular serine/threonine protein kinase FAM20C n=1 Tax=Stichopus japonicus TaxID=307972 RepID=A0A2G8L3U5_STIJA|nr:putative extracellular serine/threonine protein kinase FAM20C [Apostichopus japonicus]